MCKTKEFLQAQDKRTKLEEQRRTENTRIVNLKQEAKKALDQIPEILDRLSVLEEHIKQQDDINSTLCGPHAWGAEETNEVWHKVQPGRDGLIAVTIYTRQFTCCRRKEFISEKDHRRLKLSISKLLPPIRSALITREEENGNDERKRTLSFFELPAGASDSTTSK